MPDREETYDDARWRRLETLLRTLGARIAELDQRGELLGHAGELMRLLGDVRSELFHYEVRATYDTPEAAEHRRIVEQAQDAWRPDREAGEWTPDGEDPEW